MAAILGPGGPSTATYSAADGPGGPIMGDHLWHDRPREVGNPGIFTLRMLRFCKVSAFRIDNQSRIYSGSRLQQLNS